MSPSVVVARIDHPKEARPAPHIDPLLAVAQPFLQALQNPKKTPMKTPVPQGIFALLLATTVAASAATFTVTPSSPGVFDSNNTIGVAADFAPGFPVSSIASNGTAKTDAYFTPETLFGRPVTVGEVAQISYWTKVGATHTADPRDWFLAIYTKPYAGDVSRPTWYGDRYGAEPYFSSNLADPANTWNLWSTDGSTNKLRFFESTAGAPGTNFGSYTDPDWATFLAQNAFSGQPRASQETLRFSWQTGSAWAAGTNAAAKSNVGKK